MTVPQNNHRQVRWSNENALDLRLRISDPLDENVKDAELVDLHQQNEPKEDPQQVRFRDLSEKEV